TYFMPTPLPYVLGVEAVGTIKELGPESETQFATGQRVLALLPFGGGYAEFVSAPLDYCIPLPDHVDARDATALFVQGTTAYLMLHQLAGEVKGKSVLVHTAAGGVGSLLVQLCQQAGARVIATASTEEKLGFAKRLGAEAGVNYRTSDWVEAVIAANEGEKVDLIFEMVGGNIYEQSFGCLNTMGKMIVYGAASGEKGLVHSEHFVDESHQLLPFNLAHFMQYRFAEWQAAMGAMIGLLAEGKIAIQRTHEFPLEQAATAHAQIEARQTQGKVVLIP
ncbi:MAG: zinc-binding dehydrogenase, partial [Bacteroidota bacterium]